MDHSIVLILAGIGLLSLLAQWLAWRTSLPAILFLLAGGIALGPGLGIVRPDELFGDLLFPFVSLSVAVILFEGSLTLHRDEIRVHGTVVTNMVLWGFLVTWLVSALAARWFIGLDWPIAVLFGAIMVVTGPTVIAPMVRAVRPNNRVANILRWEGILIDPVGAILAVLTFNLIVATGFSSALDDALGILFRTLFAGFVVGGIVGYLWGYALRALWVPDFLNEVATLLIVFATFALADTIESESGLLAVTVMGVWLANMRGVHLEEILDFKESLSLLLISGLFILLAARLDFSRVESLGWPSLGVLLAIQFVARPLKVMVCAWRSDLSRNERFALSWIAPRGIVAAAISALFALRLEAEGVADAQLLVPLTFVIIVGTVVFQSLTAGALIRRLGVGAPPAEGVLIAGSGPVALTIANALKDNGLPVLVADTVWDDIKKARMAGLPTYFGNPASDHAEDHMNLDGIGKVLALSRRSDFNDVVCAHYAPEFGRGNVFSMPTAMDEDERRADKYAVASWRRGRKPFAADLSLSKFATLMGQGAEIRKTRITEEFSFENYRERNADTLIPLFAWNEKGKLRIFMADSNWQPDQGWTVASLVKPQEQAAESAS